MLTSTLIRLRALFPGELPNATGQFGHAVFLSLIETVAPALSRALHENQHRQPFTVSPLRLPGGQRRRKKIRLAEGAACSMRFTILDPTLFQLFQAAFLQAAPVATIRLQQLPFLVEEAITTPRRDGYTGFTTFAELQDRAADEPFITLRFDSPTAFSLGDSAAGKRFVLFPEPWQVFDSLCRRWNAFAGQSLADPQILRSWIEEHVWVSEYNLHSDILQFNRFAQKGFLGRVTYEIKNNDREMRRQLNALADFALYGGVGYRTSWGMGQVKRISDTRFPASIEADQNAHRNTE